MKGRPILHNIGRLAVMLGAVALVSGGTYAWQDDTQYHISELTSRGGPVDAVLVEDFSELSGWQADSGNACVSMRVSVRNDSGQAVWVRLRFAELLELADAGDLSRTDAAQWPVHLWTAGETGPADLHTHITWQLQEDATLLLSQWNALPAEEQTAWNQAGGVWLLDDTAQDGWAYYSCALPSGASTDVLLDSVTLAQPFTADAAGSFFYAVDVELDAVASELPPQWDSEEVQPGQRDNTQHRRNELSGPLVVLPDTETPTATDSTVGATPEAEPAPEPPVEVTPEDIPADGTSPEADTQDGNTPVPVPSPGETDSSASQEDPESTVPSAPTALPDADLQTEEDPAQVSPAPGQTALPSQEEQTAVNPTGSADFPETTGEDFPQ